MMEEEQKEKYANFLDKVSEILGLNRPVDILRLCAVTDKYLKPIEKRIAELEKEYASLKGLRKYELNVAKLEIEKLEKENAELKEQVEISYEVLAVWNQKNTQNDPDKLTEAGLALVRLENRVKELMEERKK